ncbi:hypothetical protein Tco_0886287 [Tanacetum coccineum]
MEEEDDDNYIWTSADYKRQSATTSLDFRRFGAMRQFDNLRVNNALNGIDNSHLMSREDYAILIKKSIRDDLSEALKKKKMEAECESEKKKRKKMREGEGEGGECESEKKKRKTDSKKMEGEGEGGECESTKPNNKNKLCVDVTPNVQPEIEDDKVKTFAEALNWMREIYLKLGPDRAEAAAKARYEAEEAAEAAEAAAKALNEAKEAAEAAAKALNQAQEAAEAAAKAKQAAAKALHYALLV